MKNHHSTFEEILNERGKIVKIDESQHEPDTFIVTFQDGTQANCDYQTHARLCLEGQWVEQEEK